MQLFIFHTFLCLMPYLCLNITAGSILAEVILTTWRISLAIILSFSKFTKPSTFESFPVQLKYVGKTFKIFEHTSEAVKSVLLCIATHYYMLISLNASKKSQEALRQGRGANHNPKISTPIFFNISSCQQKEHITIDLNRL